MNKSYFADESDYSFFGNGTLSKLLISFDCIVKDGWNGCDTTPADGVQEAFKTLRKMGYSLYLSNVPEKNETLSWLDETFAYPFCCNDEPTRYADTCDHWTTISRKVSTSLCSEGWSHCDRDIRYEDNWPEIVEIIRENDQLARTESEYVTYDDIDRSQELTANGLADDKGNQIFGSSYLQVEKLNEKTTALLKTIAKPRMDHPVDDQVKPTKERWPISKTTWDVNQETAVQYGVQIEIEQASLYYRGTWIKIKVKAVDGEKAALQEALKKFCADFGFNEKQELRIFDGYDLPWTEDQKKREEEDDRTDSFFDDYDDD